jgi:OFA family oxalate/formate antiporter-like MFS transporter
VTFAGTTVNLCLGILYAWSIWKAGLIANKDHPAGSPMAGLNEGWSYLSDAQATWAYSICGLTFALCMIPGGRIQDRFGPRIGVLISGLFLACGCLIAGYMQSFLGLILGFGICGGIGMGFGYAAATPVAVQWFGPHRRGLIVGLVVGGFGGAATYISPLGKYLIAEFGLTGSFVGFGLLFGIVVIGAGLLLRRPPVGYVPPKLAPNLNSPKQSLVDVSAREMVRSATFFLLVFLFIGSAQAGLLVIANATPILTNTATTVPFFAANAWLLAAYGGIVNAAGRIGTGFYSDRLGRSNAYGLNAILAAICLFALPSVMEEKNIALLFLLIGVVYWQYGGTLSLLPAMTADFFGPKNMGLNYGLVFLGWGIAFFVPLVAGYIRDATNRLDYAFYFSGTLLVVAIAASRVLKRTG